MARPSKYDWDSVKKAYEDGISQEVISKKYGVAKKTLANKVSSGKWEVMGGLNTHIDEFRDSLDNISRNTQNDPIKQEIAIDKIGTILEDNDLISNDRKLLKAFQGLIGRGIKDGIYETSQDIKAGVSSVKDIESIANPQASKTEIRVNTQINNDAPKTISDLYKEN
ncbi:MAG: hypothetical protein U9Q29_02905 [Campylobacterota bacterium]|nr:hypothetical protein [Campylobacterota bacterium]